MARMMWNVVLVGVVCASVAVGATFTVQIEPATALVAPGASVNYQIKGVVSNDGNLGLAIFGVDVTTDTGLAQPQASAGASMGSFVKNDGITNPAGYGGTVSGADLLQIGGGQNTIGNDGVLPHPAYPIGVVVENVALGTEIVLAEGTITAPTAPGTYAVSLANPFASVLVADTGTFYTVAPATASVGAIGSMQLDVSAALPALVSSDPDGDNGPLKTLCRMQNNCITLTFDGAVDAVGVPAIVLTAGGSDLGSSFTAAFDGAVVTVTETGAVLSNLTWYTISEGTLNVEAFSVDVCTLVGDVNGDGMVMALDLGAAWAVNGQTGPCLRADVNGDGTVMALDLGAAWPHNGETMPVK